MESKKNKYKPETEFEKKEFYNLVDKLSKLDKAGLSEDFDRKFFEQLKNINFILPFRIKIRKAIQSLRDKHRFKVYVFSASAAVILIIFILLPFKETNVPDKVLTGVDSLKAPPKIIEPEKGEIISHKKPDAEIIPEKHKTGLITKNLYWQQLVKELDNKYGLSLSKKENPSMFIKELIESEFFRESISREENTIREDTLKLLLKILKEKR